MPFAESGTQCKKRDIIDSAGLFTTYHLCLIYRNTSSSSLRSSLSSSSSSSSSLRIYPPPPFSHLPCPPLLPFLFHFIIFLNLIFLNLIFLNLIFLNLILLNLVSIDICISVIFQKLTFFLFSFISSPYFSSHVFEVSLLNECNILSRECFCADSPGDEVHCADIVQGICLKTVEN